MFFLEEDRRDPEDRLGYLLPSSNFQPSTINHQPSGLITKKRIFLSCSLTLSIVQNKLLATIHEEYSATTSVEPIGDDSSIPEYNYIYRW